MGNHKGKALHSMLEPILNIKREREETPEEKKSSYGGG